MAKDEFVEIYLELIAAHTVVGSDEEEKATTRWVLATPPHRKFFAIADLKEAVGHIRATAASLAAENHQIIPTR